MSDKPGCATPARHPASGIADVVHAYRRNWPHLKPPMFHAADVLPMLAGNDREYEAASILLEADRVFYPDGMEQ